MRRRRMVEIENVVKQEGGAQVNIMVVVQITRFLPAVSRALLQGYFS